MLPIQIASFATLHRTIFLFVGALLVLISLQSSAFRAKIPLRSRLARSEDNFVHHLMSFGFDPRIARTTYRYLQRRCMVGSPILVSDTLVRDLGLDRRSILEAVHALHVENGRLFPATRGQVEISTVLSLVALIQSSPRAELVIAA